MKTDGAKYIERFLENRGKPAARDFTFDDLMTFKPEERCDFIRDYYDTNEFDPFKQMVFLSRSQIEKALFPVAVNEKTHQRGVWAMNAYDKAVEDALKQVEDEMHRGQKYMKSALKVLERLSK